METTSIPPEGVGAVSRPKPFVAILILIGAVVLAGLACAWSLYASPLAFRGVTLFEGDYIDGRTVSFGWVGLMEKNVPVQGAVGDYASGGKVHVAVVENAGTGGQDIVMVKPETKVLTSDATRKASVSVSPDGSKVAYAALTNPPEGVYFTPELSAWTVYLLDLASGETMELGVGFAPQFLTRDGKESLLFTSPVGITVADIAARTSYTTYLLNPGLIDYVARVSPDGRHLAMPNGLLLKADVFSIERLEAPIGLKRLATTGEALISTAFVHGSFYGVERSEGKARLLKYNLDDPTAAPESYELPADSLYRVIQ